MEEPFASRLRKYMQGSTDIGISRGGLCSENQETDISIDMLYLDESLRKQGLGSYIVREIISAAKDAGILRIWIRAQPAMRMGSAPAMTEDDLVRFYEKFGFVVVEKRYPGAIMKLQL
jgi:GNAT superfamily N-acetyltransferase